MRILVTGYMDTDDLDPEHVDLSHDLGLSEKGFLFYTTELSLEDVEFKLIRATDDQDFGDHLPRGRKK